MEIRWSNSRLLTLTDCGEALRRELTEGRRPQRVDALRGTVVHRVAHGLVLRRKIEAGPAVSRDEARDAAADAFEGAWRGGVSFTREDLAAGETAVRGETKDCAVDLAGLYAREIAPQITPVAVERHVTVTPQDSDLVIYGTMDVVDSEDGGEGVRDLKTAKKSPASGTAEVSPQLTFYGMLRQAETGTLPARYALDYAVRTPVRHDLKHVRLTTTRSAEDVADLVRRLNVAVDAVRKEVFLPTSPSNWRCSEKYCEWWDDCPYVRGRRRPTS